MEDFDASSCDYSSTMPCLSSTSSSSPSSIASPFDGHFDTDQDGISTASSSFIGGPGTFLGSGDDADFSFAANSKGAIQWDFTTTLQPPESRSQQDVFAGRYDGQNHQQQQFYTSLPPSVFEDHAMLDTQLAPTQASFVEPALAFGSQQSYQVIHPHDWQHQPKPTGVEVYFSDSLSTSPDHHGFDSDYDKSFNSPSSSATFAGISESLPKPVQSSACQMKTRQKAKQSFSPNLGPTTMTKSTNVCDMRKRDGTPCTSAFRRPEHLARHKRSAAHNKNRDWACPHPNCLSKDKAFNRRDNYKAHVVNCHLVESDKPRSERVLDLSEIRRLGWDGFLSQRDKEIVKKRTKQEASRQKGCGGQMGNAYRVTKAKTTKRR
jgi:hypothetical protein